MQGRKQSMERYGRCRKTGANSTLQVTNTEAGAKAGALRVVPPLDWEVS